MLLSVVVLALGFTAVTLRFGLSLAGRLAGARLASALLALRLGVPVAAALYGLALWIRVPGNPPETLLAFFVLGAALLSLGLNRLAEMEPERILLLVEGLRRR